MVTSEYQRLSQRLGEITLQIKQLETARDQLLILVEYAASQPVAASTSAAPAEPV